MNRTEALAKFTFLRRRVDYADSPSSLSWDDFEPMEMFVQQQGVETPEIKDQFQAIKNRLTYVNGIRKGIAWGYIYPLFNLITNALANLPDATLTELDPCVCGHGRWKHDILRELGGEGQQCLVLSCQCRQYRRSGEQ